MKCAESPVPQPLGLESRRKSATEDVSLTTVLWWMNAPAIDPLPIPLKSPVPWAMQSSFDPTIAFVSFPW
eukprot:scaffold456_cov368-Pavlova_lutheri.AAC.4